MGQGSEQRTNKQRNRASRLISCEIKIVKTAQRTRTLNIVTQGKQNPKSTALTTRPRLARVLTTII